MTEQMKWTPGPWLMIEAGLFFDIMGPDGIYVVGDEGIGPGGGAEANARLIAAAPEMYEALKAVVQWADDLRYYSDEGTELAPVFQAARAAVLKAEGR